MNINYKNISKDEIRRIQFLKNELKQNLLKSIRKNHQVNSTIRVLTQYKIQNINMYTTRQKNLCTITGKSGSNYKLTNTSRHNINKRAQEGLLINIKTNNKK